MKWLLPASLLLCFSQANAATLQCSTAYASTSTSNVPTSTITKTVTATSTTTSSTYIPATASSTSTFIRVIGKKTVTVPTGPSFTPATSAPSTTGNPYGFDRRTASPDPAASKTLSTVTTSSTGSKATKFPKSVKCTDTSTSTQVSTATFTGTYTTTTYFAETYTTNVATSTAYAACATPNLLTQYQGQYVQLAYFGEYQSACNESTGTAGAIACYDQDACCESAQRNNASGFIFQFDNDFGKGGIPPCAYFFDGWQFTQIDHSLGYYVGNGASGSGLYNVYG